MDSRGKPAAETVAALAAKLHLEWERRADTVGEPGVACITCADSATRILRALPVLTDRPGIDPAAVEALEAARRPDKWHEQHCNAYYYAQRVADSCDCSVHLALRATPEADRG